MSSTRAERSTTTDARRLRVVGGKGRRQASPDDSTPPAALAHAPAPHNLPAGLPRFVGREFELAKVDTMVGAERLVTLTGPSGIGKTRLALEIASRLSDSYTGGAWFVELAPLHDPDLVPQAVATAIGLEPEPGRDPTETVIAHLSTGAALIVLDNCEHVLASCATLAARLLDACPWLRILATSQQQLGVGGELSWALKPLSLFEALPTSVEEALECEAVALFCVRAESTEAGFSLNEETLPAVAEICDRLEGIPLAIELAAARIASLGPADIAERLERRFRLLTGGPRTADARHRTLRAALDWSYDLLSPEEAVLLRRLSVFAGGATLPAVEAVCAGKGVDRDDVVDLLGSLVAKSLVMADTTRAHARYRLLETIRAYGRERLEEEDDGEGSAVRERHAKWCVSLVERAWHQVGDSQQFWTNILEADHDNIRAALEWGLTDRPQVALRLAGALTPFWKTRGYFREGQEWLRRAVEANPDGPPAFRARALFGLAMLATMRGEVDVAREAAERSLSLARDGDFRRAEAQALNLVGFISIFGQDPLAAKPVLEESVAKARANSDPGSLIGALALCGRAHLFLGDIAGARAVFEECLALAHDTGDNCDSALIGLGWTAMAAGELDPAQDLFDRALSLLRRAGERFETSLVLSFLGELAWARGRLDAATALLEEGRDLAMVMGAPFPLTRCLSGLARVAVAGGDAEAATALGDEAYDVATKASLPYALVRALHVRGDLRRSCGDAEAARSAYEEALAVARANADSGGVAGSLYRLGRLARSGGADDDAMTLFVDALKSQAETGDGGLMSSLEAIAGLATELGRTTTAAGLFASAQAMREALGSVRTPEEVHDYEADLSALRSTGDSDDLEAAWAQGAVMSRDDVLALAVRGRGARDRPTHGWASLSPTERQIVELVADGLTNREIGERLFISARTVQGYLARVFPKLGVSSRRGVRDSVRQR